MTTPSRYDCSGADLSYFGTGPCTGCAECCPELRTSEISSELARHYSDDRCPDDCSFCADLARIDAMVARADKAGEEWPPIELGGES